MRSASEIIDAVNKSCGSEGDTAKLKVLKQAINTAQQNSESEDSTEDAVSIKEKQDKFDALKKKFDDAIDLELAKEKEEASREKWSAEVNERRQGRSLNDLKEEIRSITSKISVKELEVKEVEAEIESVRSASEN